jgi:hypothetical protein
MRNWPRIIGLSCSHKTDPHLWQPIAASSAKLIYYERFQSSIDAFEEWAAMANRSRGRGFETKQRYFDKTIDGPHRDLELKN